MSLWYRELIWYTHNNFFMIKEFIQVRIYYILLLMSMSIAALNSLFCVVALITIYTNKMMTKYLRSCSYEDQMAFMVNCCDSWKKTEVYPTESQKYMNDELEIIDQQTMIS